MNTSLTTKERGDALEDIIIEELNQYPGLSPKKTNGSGAVHGDGDVITSRVIIDSKVKGKGTSISISRAEFNKIRLQAAHQVKPGAIATFIQSESDPDSGTVVVCIELHDLFNLLTGGH
jgi:hypothetical protein